MVRKIILNIAAVTSIALMQSCGGSSVPTDLDSKQPDKGPSPEYKFVENYSTVFEFEQGFYHEYDLASGAKVPSGSPLLSIDQLPKDATFDGKLLKWKPRCGEDKALYDHDQYGIHPILITLKSDADPAQFVQRSGIIVVHKFKEFDDRKCPAS